MALCWISMVVLLLYTAGVVPQETGTNTVNSDSLEVIIDTDPGADDAMAILLMLSQHSRAKVLALTAVTGNTGGENATRNALLILEVANRLDIPVYSGSNQALVFHKEIEFYFGYDGIGDSFPEKPNLNLRKDGHAALAIVNIIKEKPGRVTLLCIGPLTNLALAMHMYPKLLEDVKEVVILGGSYAGGGSRKPGVEFNAYADPEAAAYVFSKVPENRPLTVVPSETTKALKMSMVWRIKTLGKIDSCFMKFLNRAEGYSLAREKTWGLADQVAASILLNPSIVKSTRNAFIVVETCGNFAQGAYLRDSSNNRINVKFITEVDKGQLKQLLIEYLDSPSQKCTIENQSVA